jgi:ribosomal protein S24E
MVDRTMPINLIARKIAFIKCKHKEKPCIRCIGIQKSIVMMTDKRILEVVVQHLEPGTKLEKVTPLTWCDALDLTREIEKVL